MRSDRRILVINAHAIVINRAFANEFCTSAMKGQQGTNKKRGWGGIEHRRSHHGVSTLLFVTCKINCSLIFVTDLLYIIVIQYM